MTFADNAPPEGVRDIFVGAFVEAWPLGFSLQRRGWRGHVAGANGDGTFFIRFDDGECRDLPLGRIKVLDAAGRDDSAEEALGSIMGLSVEDSTELGLDVQGAGDAWGEYLDSIPGLHGGRAKWLANDGRYTELEWTRRVLLFYAEVAIKGEDVRVMHQSLRHALMRNGRPPTFMDNSAVAEFFKGYRKWVRPKRAEMIQRFIEKRLPVPREFYRTARETLWKGEAASTTKGRTECLVYLVCVLMYVSLYRISNFAHTVADHKAREVDKHAVRNADVFVVSNPQVAQGIHPIDREVGRDLIAPLHHWVYGRANAEQVLGVAFIFWTRKNQAYHAEPFWLKRGRSGAEDQALGDFLVSRLFCVRGPTDLVFAQVSDTKPEGRRLLSKEVNEGMKRVAAVMGFDPTLVSSTCNRIAGMSNRDANGFAEVELLQDSQHASFSTVRRHYLFPVEDKVRSDDVRTGFVGITTDHGYSTRELHERLLVQWAVRDNLASGAYGGRA